MAHGTWHTAPKCLVPTANVDRVKNARRTFAKRLPSFLTTDARNPCAPYLPTPNRNSSRSDEARATPAASSSPRLCIAERRQKNIPVGRNPQTGQSEAVLSSHRDRQPPRQENLSQNIGSRPAWVDDINIPRWAAYERLPGIFSATIRLPDRNPVTATSPDCRQYGQLDLEGREAGGPHECETDPKGVFAALLEGLCTDICFLVQAWFRPFRLTPPVRHHVDSAECVCSKCDRLPASSFICRGVGVKRAKTCGPL